ncbi:hypothetical protein C8R48DRAFT_679788 [Suillus tomentosus]|nr:hypothetical protein C8R48DRAFT_679788 [Suillus tomentosus]
MAVTNSKKFWQSHILWIVQSTVKYEKPALHANEIINVAIVEVHFGVLHRRIHDFGTFQADVDKVRPRVSRFLRGAAPAKKVNLEGAADPSSKALPSGSKVADPPRELTKSQAKVRGSSGLLLTTALRPQSSTKATSHHLVVLKVGAEVGDVKLARMSFGSLIKSNPKHCTAAARLGEGAGLTVAARELIKQVAKGVPRAMMYGSRQDGYTYDGCKVILANADQHVGQSVKTRPTAADLGRDLSTLKNQLRIPAYSPVEVVPLSVELWPALTHPETPERAKVVLNKAHEAVPKSHEI